MSFEEMQSILQGILLSHQEFQSNQRQIQLSHQEFKSDIVEMNALTNSNSRAIQAMLDQAAADRLENQERARRSEEEMQELRVLANSNGRAIQAMLDQSATDRLDNQERARRHEEEMRELKAISRGLVNLAVSIDEDRPTILRLLNSNDNKLDAILDRLPPQQ
jgi:histidyl-tRNA synthetase